MPERQSFKAIVLGTLYLRGAGSIASVLGLSYKKAQDLIDTFFKRFPNAKRYLKGTIRFIRKHGYVREIYGRIRHLPDAFSNDESVRAEADRSGVNSTVQSASADYVSMGLRRVDSLLEDFNKKYDANNGIILTVHDSILMEVRDDLLDEVIQVCAKSMVEPVLPIDVTMAVDAGVGKSWGNLKDYPIS